MNGDCVSTENGVVVHDVILERLDKLRSVDKLVDISKSSIQFEILLALGEREIFTSEIARNIGQRRKATTDALRKLKNKGLLVATSQDGETMFKLSESGTICHRNLMDLIGIVQPEPRPRPYNTASTREKVDRYSLVDSEQSRVDLEKGQGNFALTAMISELVLALGTAKGNAMSLRELAKITNLSEQRTESYLKLYNDREPRLFKKFVDDPSWTKGSMAVIGMRAKAEPMYGLTNEGLQYFSKMPVYTRLKGSLAYRLLSKITMTSYPRSIYRRLALLAYAGGVASMAFMILPYGFIITGLWLFITTIIGTVMASGPSS